MIYLILDTNYWIYLAKGEHPKVFDKLKQFIDEKKVEILVNQVIIDEWNKNRDDTIRDIEKRIRNQAVSAENLSEFLIGDDKATFKQIIQKYKTNEDSRINAALNRINAIEDIFNNQATWTTINDQMKIDVVQLALTKKAPFVKERNSIGDALILLSTIEYLKQHSIFASTGVKLSDAIFVTYNHKDFSKSDGEKDEVHPHLAPLFDSVKMKYVRNIGQILNLTPKMVSEIDEYIEHEVDSWIDWQVEIMMGR